MVGQMLKGFDAIIKFAVMPRFVRDGDSVLKNSQSVVCIFNEKVDQRGTDIRSENHFPYD